MRIHTCFLQASNLPHVCLQWTGVSFSQHKTDTFIWPPTHSFSTNSWQGGQGVPSWQIAWQECPHGNSNPHSFKQRGQDPAWQ